MSQPLAPIGEAVPDLALEPQGTRSSAAYLAEAFAEFVTTSSRLENSYRQLQGEVSGLRVELEERNAALQSSLAENERVRQALQQIVYSMPVGVLVAGGNGDVSTINPEAERILGIHEPSASRSLQQITAHTGLHLAAKSGSEQELCHHTSTGERWLQIGTRHLQHGSTGSEAGQTIFILRDITAQKRAEREREAARNAVALAEITTMLAHEIRNPLASLELFAELIEQDGANQPEWIANLRAGIRSLSGTVNNVLSFHDSRSLKFGATSLTDVAQSTVRFMQPLADQSGVKLRYNGVTTGLHVTGNDSALQQVVLNLIKNAIRHTPADGTVTVSLHTAADTIILRCTDSGPGIRPDQLGRLFEAGFSGSGDTPGLGLAVCARIVRQHNGSISAHNVPGTGACFQITFPASSQEFATA